MRKVSAASDAGVALLRRLPPPRRTLRRIDIDGLTLMTTRLAASFRLATLGRIFLLTAALGALPGCTRYYVFAHDPPKDGYRVETLRRPLQAAVTAPDNSDKAFVLAALNDSGWFSTLSAPRASADVAIDYLGVSCGEPRSAADSAVGTYAATLKFLVLDLPTLGMLPTTPEETADCAVNFRYEILKPRASGPRDSGYDYKRLRFGVAFAGAAYTSPEKQKQQTKVLFDTSVAKMLTEMAPAVAPLQSGL